MQHQDINKKLTLAAAALAQSSPNRWREFVEALSDLSDQHRVNLVMSPLPELQVNQGRAQILSTLHDKLANCIAEADKLNKGTR